MRAVTAGVAALLLAAAAGGCSGRATQARTTYHDPHPLPQDTMTVAVATIGTHGGRFVIAQTSDPKTFNAMMANETSSSDITNLMFASLTELDYETQAIYGQLARSWDVSPDGLTWTFHLRRGARFSDGHPITAEDVLFSFEVAYDEVLHPSVQDLIQIDGKPFDLSAPDSHTVVMRAAGVHPLMAEVVGAVRVMPKHVLEPAFRRGAYAAAYAVSTPAESLVSSGAWRLARFQAGEKVVLARNAYWFGVDPEGQRLPYLDEVVFLTVPDMNTAAIKFQAGEVDAIDNVKPEDYATYAEGAERGNYTLYDLGPSLNTNFLWFNLNKVREARPGKRVGDPQVDPVKYSWFKERDFRRAVSMAIDRDALIRGPFYGDAIKNWAVLTVASKQWATPHLTGADYDPEGAKRLLDRLGFRDRDGDGIREDPQGRPVSFTMKTNSDNTLRVSMMNFVRDDLAKVGLRMLPTPVDFNTLVTNLRQDFQYESMMLGFGSAVPPDPGMGGNVYRSSGLTHYWNIKQPRPETPAEAEIDRLFAEHVGTRDLAARKRSFERIVQIINDEAFLIWLPTLEVKVPVRNRFGNVHPSVIPHRILWNIDRVYLKPRQPAA